MLRPHFSGFLLCAAVLAGCGGGKERPVTVAPTRGEAAPLPPIGPPTPVTAPSGVFAIARVKSPAHLADAGVAWAALPVDWRSLITESAPGLLDAVDVEAPVDLVAMLDPRSVMEPRVLWAFSFGARSAEAAAAYFRGNDAEVVEESRGAYRIRVDDDLVCRAAPARGRAPSRVVCSDDADATSALSPYMSRGLPEESFGTAEVHAHVLAEPFLKRYGAQLPLLRTVGVPFILREISVDDPRLDRALRDAAYALADEAIALSRDLGRLDVDLAFSSAGDAIEAGVSLGFVGSNSWIAGNVGRAAARSPVPVPEQFFKLPADAVGAGYTTFADPARMRPVAAGLAALAEAGLEYLQLPEARRVALARALEATLTTGTDSVYATMNVAPTPLVGGASEAEKILSTVRSAVGMHLLAIEGGGTAASDLASELVKALGDRALRARLATLLSIPEEHLPAARQSAVRAPGIPAGARAFEFLLPAALMAPGARTEEQSPTALSSRSGKTVKKKVLPAKKATPLSVVLVVAPDGPRTWLALGTDVTAVSRRLAATLAGEGDRLQARAGLEALRQDPGLSGGFATLAASLASLSASGSPPLNRLPSRGETPMVWTVRADAAGPRIAMRSRVPRAVVEDLIAWTSSLRGGFLPR